MRTLSLIVTLALLALSTMGNQTCNPLPVGPVEDVSVEIVPINSQLVYGEIEMIRFKLVNKTNEDIGLRRAEISVDVSDMSFIYQFSNCTLEQTGYRISFCDEIGLSDDGNSLIFYLEDDSYVIPEGESDTFSVYCEFIPPTSENFAVTTGFIPFYGTEPSSALDIEGVFSGSDLIAGPDMELTQTRSF